MLFTGLVATHNINPPYIVQCSHMATLVITCTDNDKSHAIVIILKKSAVFITYRHGNSTNEYLHKQQKTDSELEWFIQLL